MGLGVAGLVGEVKMWAGTPTSVAPNTPVELSSRGAPGWLLCNGAPVLQSDYPNLFSVVGTTYNTGGETSQQFRLPNLQGRVPVGQVASGTFQTLGGQGGAEQATLVAANLPSHTHGATTGAESTSHSHTVTTGTESQGHIHGGTTAGQSVSHNHGGVMLNGTTGNGDVSVVLGAGTVFGVGITTPASVDHTHSYTTGGVSANHTHSGTTAGPSTTHTHSLTTDGGSGLSGTGHSNLPPFLVMNYVIKF